MNFFITAKSLARVFLFIFLSSCFFYVNAGESPVITGNVKDQHKDLPIAYVTVSLHLPADTSLVEGGVADEDGFFKIIPPGKANYLLRISFVGYRIEFIPISWDNTDNLDLGTVYLEKENFVLEEARVIGERLKAKSEGNNTVYYMNSSLYKISNSGADLLKQIPGARFDLMKNFSVEGKTNVLIYVDGIERDMDYVRQIDAEQVDRVEVNSSPGAGYESNTGAVINMVLKEKKQGISGHVNAELPTSSSEIYLFPSYNLNYGREKFNIYTSYNGAYSYFDIQNINSVLVREDSGSNLYRTIQDVRQKNWSHRFHAGIDYFLNDKNRINIYTSFHPYSWEQDGSLKNSIEGNVSAPSFINGSREDTDWNRLMHYSAYFEHIFDKPSTKLSTDISYSTLRASNTILYKYESTDSKALFEQLNQVEPASDLFSIKSDFNTLFDQSISYSAGIKISHKIMQDLTQKGFEHMKRKYAIYNSLSGKFSRWSFDAGLRLENVRLTSDKAHDRELLSLLPNLNLQFKISERQNLNFNYRRSVELPTIYQLNPTIQFEDAYYAYEGNPQLEPAINNFFKINHNIRPGKNFLSASAFYQKQKNAIAKTFSVNDTGIIISTTRNPGDIEKFGLQLSGTWKINNFVSFNHYLQLFGIQSKTQEYYEYMDVPKGIDFGLETSLGAIINLDYDINLSLQYQYNSPVREFQLQTWNDPLYFFSIEKNIGTSLKLGLRTALPFQKKVRYHSEKVEADTFNLQWTGAIKKSLIPVWINISYKFQSGKKVSLIEREKEILENVRKKGF